MAQRTDNNLAQSASSLLEDVELALSNLSHQEIQLIRETEDLFKQQVNYMIQIDRLKKHIPNMKAIFSHKQNLSALVDSSYSLVEDVCSKFRRIDMAKSRLDDSLSKIGDILDLKTCRDGMIRAMQSNAYDEAALHIKRFLSIDQTELQRTIAIICDDHKFQKQRKALTSTNTFGSNKTVSQANSDTSIQQNQVGIAIDPNLMNLALRELDQARCQLLNICKENMTRAIADNSSRDIERFFKIFPMLNEHNEGLQQYSDYLKSKMIDSQLDLTLSSKESNQAEKLTALYESIAKLIDTHQPMIETFYGPGHLIVVARVIQKECDRLSRKVLEEFRNQTNLQQVAKIVRSVSHLPIIINAPPQNTSATHSGMTNLNMNPNTKIDPRNVDNILNEITLIISRSEVYLRFITQRILDDIEAMTDNDVQKKASKIELYNMMYMECELNHLIQEVGGIYVMLEQFYMNESSKKAFLMDQIEMDPSFGTCFISSMLDDIFFIIKRCTKRAISTKSNEVFCAIINHCVTLLESTFCQLLEDRLRNQQYYTSFSAKNLDFSQAYNALQSGRYLQSATDQRKSNGHYFSALNNLDKAGDYIRTLRTMLDSDVKKLKPSNLASVTQHDSQIEKSITCLNELSRLGSRFASVIYSSFYQMFNTSLRARIKAELKVFLEENPDLSIHTEETSTEQLTSLAKSLLKNSDPCLEEGLFPDNYAKLVSITRDFLSSTIKSMK